jgi:hypothetical protein
MSDADPWLSKRLLADLIAEIHGPLETPDETFKQLWSQKLSEALAAAETLYAPAHDGNLARPETQEKVELHFWRILMKFMPVMPETPEARYRAVVFTIARILRAVRATPTDMFAEEYLAVALRPVRRLSLGALTDEVCAALIDYHRGQWNPHLTRSQLYIIEVALAKTVAALPPDNMEPFWEHLLSADPVARGAMLLGLRHLSEAHAVRQLLHGLEELSDHATRAAIVDHLEKMAEPSAIPTLIRLRRETANTDWTLSRQIARAIRVIERQNDSGQHRVLLRPATAPPDEDRSLLRPMIGDHPADPAELLRPVEPAASPADPPDSKSRKHRASR